MIDAINPGGIWSPFGAFSMAVIQGDGQVVHLKGQVSLDQQGKVVGAHDMRAQMRKTLENIAAVLGSMGGRMEDIVRSSTTRPISSNSWPQVTSGKNASRNPFR